MKSSKTFHNFQLLFVATIIFLLYLSLPSLYVAKERSVAAKIITTLSGLTAALKQYETDWGMLPPHTPKIFDSRPLVIYLDGNPANGGTKTAYFEFKPDDCDFKTEQFLDHWKRSYHYRQPKNPDGTSEPTTVNKDSFDLWSEGITSIIDGDVQGSDDFTNWKPYTGSSSVFHCKPGFYIEGYFLFLFLFFAIFLVFFYFLKKIMSLKTNSRAE